MKFISQIEDKRDEVLRLCKKYNVQKLELFGSAENGLFNPASSDLDFLVAFKPMPPAAHSDCYFGLLDGLQEMFQTSIDLVELQAVRNPYFLEAIQQNRSLLYAA